MKFHHSKSDGIPSKSKVDFSKLLSKETPIRAGLAKKVMRKASSKDKELLGHIKGNFSLLLPIFQNSLPKEIFTDLPSYIDLVIVAHNSYITNLGIKFGTSYWKKITQYCTLLSEGRTAEAVSYLSTGKQDKWPNKLGFLRPIFHYIIDDSKDFQLRAECLRLLLTLFKLNGVCNDFSETDTKGITQKYQVPQDIVRDYEQYLKDKYPTTDEDRLLNLGSLKVDKFVFGPSNGPNSVYKLHSAASLTFLN
jgi:hypothetical protein